MPTANISMQRLRECILSAEFWATHINLHSDRMQELADRYAIVASLVSAVTGFAAWQSISQSPAKWAQVLVVVMAFTAAVVAVIPKVKAYGECALKALPLAAEYGKALGLLEDALGELHSHDSDAQTHAQEAINAFQQVKVKKDALKPFPKKLEAQLNQLRGEATKTKHEVETAKEAKQAAREAERAAAEADQAAKAAQESEKAATRAAEHAEQVAKDVKRGEKIAA